MPKYIKRIGFTGYNPLPLRVIIYHSQRQFISVREKLAFLLSGQILHRLLLNEKAIILPLNQQTILNKEGKKKKRLFFSSNLRRNEKTTEH